MDKAVRRGVVTEEEGGIKGCAQPEQGPGAVDQFMGGMKSGDMMKSKSSSKMARSGGAGQVKAVQQALKDKGVGTEGTGGAARKTGGRSGGRKSDKGAIPSATEQAGLSRERAARSPIQSLKASVKKAVAGKSSKSKARKPRRG